MSDLLHHIPGLLDPPLPSAPVLDAYQLTVVRELTVYDAGGQHIGGIPLADYFHDGFREELQETIGKDPLNPSYNRLGAILMLDSMFGQYLAGETSPLARSLHQKEFGDVSWYLAHLLNLRDISMGRALNQGVAAIKKERKAADSNLNDLHNFIETTLPALLYFGYAQETLQTSQALRESPDSSPPESLAVAAGKLIVAVNQLCRLRLGIAYEAVLDQNAHKIRDRISRGTVFDPTGGDNR